ncbi:MAG: phytoene/squalene synthase family protein [Proteobacteria bacterium]|nr:phytoene/squalene synthase family protein [Pseudomonadota bacterium]
MTGSHDQTISAPGRATWRSEAIRRCRATIAEHSKSFALASRVFPPACRDHAAVVYTWCRRADDAVDGVAPGEQPAALARIRAELDMVYSGSQPSDITLAAFAAVVEQCRIPREYPEELLAGMEMDVRGTLYDSLDTLLLYCFRVAGTVGLMMSHVMRLSDQSALKNAAHMGIAMQLTNICRDVVEDWTLGRLYLPDDLLSDHGASNLATKIGQEFPDEVRPAMARAVRWLLAEADRYYASGDRGLIALPWRCAFAVRAARCIYSAIGARIARNQYDVTRGRAIVPGWVKLLLLARAGLASLGEIPRRIRRRLLGGRQTAIPAHKIRFPENVLPL